MQLSEFTEVSVILQPGVYALCMKGQVIYVGKAKNLYSRIYTHRNLSKKDRKSPSWMPQSLKGIRFDQVFVLPCHVDRLDQLEHDMINKYKPKYNISLKNGLKVKVEIPLRINGITLTLNRPTPEPMVRRRVA